MMAMFRIQTRISGVAAFITWFGVSNQAAAQNGTSISKCPEDSVPYTVVDGDSLQNIVAQCYGLDPIKDAAPTKDAVTRVQNFGPNGPITKGAPQSLGVGWLVCIPKHLTLQDRELGLNEEVCLGKPYCGNGRIDDHEVCDGADLHGFGCEALGLLPGTLRCKADCTGFDPVECGQPNPVCGNGRMEGNERCDETDLGGLSCESIDRPAGTLKCKADCTGFDSSACGEPARVCGNGRIEKGEQCDGMNLGDQTCEGRGFSAGTLSCNADCSGWDESKCIKVIKTPKPTRPMSIGIEALGGIALPYGNLAREQFFQSAGMIGLGVRFRWAWLEAVPRFLGVGSWGGHTRFNDMDASQTLMGFGGALQVGLPITRWSPIQITPGIEGSLLYMRRKVERGDYPYEGQMENQAGALPAAGAYLRVEYPLPMDGRMVLAGVELSSDMMMMQMIGLELDQNFTAKMMGGVCYVF